MNEIDMQYRPESYFGPTSLGQHLLATVTGAERQRYIRTLIEENRLQDCPAWIAKESLTEEERSAASRVDPRFMGGEFLPDLRRGEVEIARINLESTTADVISVRAFQGKGPIRYRVCDEYYPDSNVANIRRTSKRPLTLAQLEAFIEEAGAGIGIVRCCLDGDGIQPERYRNYLSATSPFYLQLKSLYQLRVEQLLKDFKCGPPKDDDGVASGRSLRR
jgi:hypothetical protein